VNEVTVGTNRFRVVAVPREDAWVAYAERLDNGDRFGVEFVGQTEAEASERVAGWLRWQHEHTEALEALQQAERAYHRTIAGSAFASPTEGPSAVEMQKESLDAVEAARLRLDEVRARRPE
jgi:hypothetical protein